MTGTADRRIRVLIVEDSSAMRAHLTAELQSSPGIEVIGTELDATLARERISTLHPDVVLFDVEQQESSGLGFLQTNLRKQRFPVIALSSRATAGSEAAIQALEAGAFDVSTRIDLGAATMKLDPGLVGKIREAARFAPRKPAVGGVQSRPQSVSRRTAMAGRAASQCGAQPVVLIGASTGGTEAIRDVLRGLPADVPGIAIVQHIPAKFSQTFAQRLNSYCQFEVREAEHGDALRAGLALVAPGDYHMVLERSGAQYFVRLHQGPQVHHQRPAVDVLFNSAVEAAGDQAVGVLLTGMGRDGAEGLRRLRDCGARTLAQDEASCVVFGMPQAAQKLGAAERMVSLAEMPQAILWCLEQNRRASNRPAALSISPNPVVR